ncbi:AAA family ATPase [Saccharopolyspora sp. NPDC002686]|uniref:AAA family ATPase n=1 Tax=Saccharopolyspora sp. NPDC002686 TaxID=3154541 RepID=UPI00331CA695
MITDAWGVDVEPELAEVLGDGSELAAEAAETGCRFVEPAHFLALLARCGGTILHTTFFRPRGVDPTRFCELLYGRALDEDREPGMPTGTGAEAMSEASRHLLDLFAQRANASGTGRAGEGLFVLTLLDLVPQARPLLVAIAGSDEAFEQFLGRLEDLGRSSPPAELFDPTTGVLQSEAFDGSGKRVLTLLREEMAALGCRRATVLHLLYALVGIDSGMLQNALQFQGIDPLREVHSALALQLRRPASKRVDRPELSGETLYPAVVEVLKQAVAGAARFGAKPGEVDIARAAVAQERGVIADWLAGRGLDPAKLRDYLEHAEPADDEDVDEQLTPVAEIGDRLRERILGQDHAVARILPWIKRLRFGFPRDRGPAAVLLFLGPSGSGKTELAKELARVVYGSDEHLLMLEMGQFATKESLNVFIGAPPGYVGYGEGKLTNGLRDKPLSVVLLDEIEKAHEDVWPALLRFLDEGLIDDPAGPTRDGRGCVVVLTSNLGSEVAPPAASVEDGRLDDAAETEIREVVLKYLKRPEIYNRVDDKIVFRAFDEHTYRELVGRQVALETARFADRGVDVQVLPEVSDWLTRRATAGHREGARIVPRLTSHYLVSPVIDVLTLGDGGAPERVVVGLRGDRTFAEGA